MSKHYDLTPHDPVHIDRPKVPEPISHVSIPEPHNWFSLINQCSYLFHTARSPRNDEAWFPLSRQLVEYRYYLESNTFNNNEEEKDHRLYVIRWYLGF
jgi:hypothetical protein